MSERIAAAASETGIGLTLLPIFYAHSTFGGAAPGDRQRRFINDLDGYALLLDGCRAATSAMPGAVVGVAPHSLRAVTAAELATVATLAADGPVHIHAAEQMREVEDCLAWSGARPVEWLLANAGLDARWCLIHATHMTEAETQRPGIERRRRRPLPDHRSQSRRRHVSCDRSFAGHGGRFGIGSDSNVLIGVADELRQLEYSQRLRHRARNVMAPAERVDRPRIVRRRAGRWSGVDGRVGTGTAGRRCRQPLSLDAGHPALVGAERRCDPRCLDLRKQGQGYRRLRLGQGRKTGGGRQASPAEEDVDRFRAAMEALLAA